MREIKFRAWDTKEKRIIEQGLFIECNGLVFHDEGDMGYLLKEIAKKDRYIIMQFTGLKDKNGKEIFEGDIIQDCAGKCEVKWLNVGMFNICPFTDEEEKQDRLIKAFEKIEVIGNKFENPELLEEKKQK